MRGQIIWAKNTFSRRTNIFLRLVLFLFTVIIVGAAVAMQATGIFLMIFGAISYAVAELAVSQARLYRYGIEEALAACSVGFLCAGMQALCSAVTPIRRSRTERNS
jgi:hypothetical protein